MKGHQANRPFGRLSHPYGGFPARALLLAALALAACGTAGTSGTTSTASIGPGPRPHCPKKARHLRFTHDERTAHSLVPAGATSLVLCAYHGLNPKVHQVGELATSRRITSRVSIASLTSLFDGLPPDPFEGGVTNCPMDNGSKEAAIFGYRGEPPVTVSIRPTGCAFVSNGDLRRALTPRLERALSPT
jgi:hypothetical protein